MVWAPVIGESGSNYIYKYMNIFRDAVALGGSPDRIGQIVHTSMLEQVLLPRETSHDCHGLCDAFLCPCMRP